jgi:hypothetical protein
MAAHVRTVEISEVDRRELQRRARSKGAPARVVERARIVAAALRRAGPGRVGGPAAAWFGVAVARGAAGSGAGADPDRAADSVRGDTLVLAAAGRGAGGRGDTALARHRRPDLAPLRRAAVARGDVQVLHRPRTRGQDPRRRRAVSPHPAGPARSRSAAAPTPDAAAASPGPPPPPPPASGADTTPADATDPTGPRARSPHSGPARRAASAGTPPTAARPRTPDARRRSPSAPQDSAAPPR